jgi:hypothetical protein
MGMVGNFTVNCPPVTVHISAAGNTTFCSGGSVVLNSTSTGGANQFQWKKNGNNITATNSSYTAKTSGSYNLSATNSCGSVATSNAINVTVNPLPNATITPTGIVNMCTGDSVKLKANTATALGYQWLRYGVAISGATASQFYAKQGGYYKVKVTKLTTGCSKTSVITNVVINCKTEPVGTSDKVISIFPSPSSDQFTMEFPDYQEARYETVIYDGLGARKYSFPVTAPMMKFGNELANGLYYIEIRNGDQVMQREKVIKMK